MDAVEYLKIKTSMSNRCNTGNGSCDCCPLSSANNSKGIYCDELEEKYPGKAVEIVENWAKEHPVKTYLSVLLEKFPKVQMIDIGVPKFCCTLIFNAEEACQHMSCQDCWNREYKEETN